MLVKLDTGFNIEIDFAITPFHRRFFAWVIDTLILIAYLMLVSKALSQIFGAAWGLIQWLVVLYWLPPLFYHLLCEVFLNGQSLGKKMLGIKVITAEGGQPSLSQYLIRWIFRLVDLPLWLFEMFQYEILPWWCAIFLFGGLACVLISRHAQRIGDLVAGTLLVNTRSRASWEDTVFTELEVNYKPRFPAVMKLSDKDINTLKTIISTVRKKGDYELSMRIGERIKSKLQIQSDQDSLDFLETLLKDYNYYATN